MGRRDLTTEVDEESQTFEADYRTDADVRFGAMLSAALRCNAESNAANSSEG